MHQNDKFSQKIGYIAHENMQERHWEKEGVKYNTSDIYHNNFSSFENFQKS